MAKANQNDVKARREAMERSKVHHSKNHDEKQRRKEQLRLEKQEQRLADRLERQNQKRVKQEATKAKKEQAAAPSWDQKVKTFVSAQQRQKKQKPKQQEKEFQIVLGTKHKRILQGLSFVSLLLVAIIVVNSLVPIGIWEYTQNLFASGGKGEGFPVSVSSSGTNTMVQVGSDIALMGDAALTLYKSNGKMIFQRQHGYSNPGVCSCTARVMVYDRGGQNLRVENRAKTLFTKETEGTITTATMANNGSFAVVTRGLNYISDVVVYDSNGDQSFIWHSASRQVMGISLSDNGRYLGVSTLSVENGQGVTQLLLFDTRKGTTLVEERYEGSTPISLDVKGSVLVGVLNDRVVSVTKSGQKAEYPYNGGSVTCFDNGSEFGTVLVLGMYQNSLNNRLLLLDEDMDVISDTEISSEVLGVSVKGNRLALLSNSQVLFYNRRGKAKGAGELVADGKYVLCKGNFAVVMGAETLQRVGKTSSSLQNS